MQRKLMPLIILTILACLWSLNRRVVSLSNRPVTISKSNQLPGLYSRISKSVVYIKCYQGSGGGSASGVVIGEHTILTAAHVVRYMDDIKILDYKGNNIPVVCWEIDSNDDCAIITTAIKLSGIIQPAKTATVGEHVIVIGEPFGKTFYNTMTYGIITGLNRHMEYFGVSPMLTVDAATNPGNSGGPVLNMDGKLIGIVSGSIRGADNLGIITTVKTVKEFLNGRQL